MTTLTPAQKRALLIKTMAATMKQMRGSGTPGLDQPSYADVASAILALIHSALSDVTPEMVEEGYEALGLDEDWPELRKLMGRTWRAMLDASALNGEK